MMLKFETNMENANVIIREFDSSISQKANKVTFQEFVNYVKETYIKKADSKNNKETFKNEMTLMKEESNKVEKTIQAFNKDLNRRIEQQMMIFHQ